MRSLACAVVFFLCACASGPRPMPAGVSAKERLERAEAALLGAKNLSGSFEIESTGQNPSKFTGTLELAGGNAVWLTVDGRFRDEDVHAELDSRSGDINRTVTKGASVNGHRDPPASHLGEAIVVGLARMGLLHNLATLSQDKPIDSAQTGVGDSVKNVDAKDGAADQVGGEACHRVEFVLEVGGRSMGEGTVCISDATSLPLHRRTLVHFPDGDMTATETWRWTQKP